jgi:hypothetical protein
MKLATCLALGAAMSIAAMTAPAVAQNNKPSIAASAFKLSKEFRAVAAPAQAAIQAKNVAEATPKVAAAEAAAIAADEKYVAGQLRLQLAGLANDKVMQAKAVQAMIESGSPAATAELPKLNFFAGQFAYTAGDYPRAAYYLGAAEKAGYTDNGNVYLMLAETSFKNGQVPVGLGYVERAIASQKSAGQKAPESWYSRAISVAFTAKMMNEAGAWSREQLRAYPNPDNWRKALIVHLFGAERDQGQNIDIYRLKRVTKAMAGESDYLQHAQIASARGLPGEAKSVLDEGLASKVISASSSAASQLRATVSGKIAADQASLAASERQANTTGNGRLAASTADAYLAYGQDAKAITLYKTALTKGGADVDAVNMRMGIALARSGDKAGARQAFQAVKGPRTETAAFWLLWLDQQVA